MLPGKVDHGLANPELGQGHPAVLQFRYNMGNYFVNVCNAFLRKYEWEPAARLTTIERVEQLDDDRIVLYRRHDHYLSPFVSFEQILINRQNQSVESDFVGPNPNGSAYSTSKTIIRPDLCTKDAKSIVDQMVYDVQGQGSGKIEIFKAEVVRLHRALKFDQWAAEQ